MPLDSLLSRRLVFLSGKGGVGKSVVSLALALAARERGKRVLLVEIEAPLEPSSRIAVLAAAAGERGRLPALSTLNLDGRGVMDEYIRRTVKLGLLARRILASPVYERFFAAAPGLPELMLLGRILLLEQQRGRGRRPHYDLIVVDTPATGHGLESLEVPRAASRAIPVGPVGNNARRILELLKDPQRTALAIVAVPEEMAVQEAIELHRLAQQEVGIDVVAVYLNRCFERRFRRWRGCSSSRPTRASTSSPARPVPRSTRRSTSIVASARDSCPSSAS
jgi:anion-transporting  ArsA/GET3 family ATPase